MQRVAVAASTRGGGRRRRAALSRFSCGLVKVKMEANVVVGAALFVVLVPAGSVTPPQPRYTDSVRSDNVSGVLVFQSVRCTERC